MERLCRLPIMLGTKIVIRYPSCPNFTRNLGCTLHGTSVALVNVEYNAVFVFGRSYRRKRQYYARYQTASPTRMGMLQSIQARVVRYRGCPVRSEVAHTKGRGDGNPAARVRNVDPRQGALANGTPQVSPTDHWLLVPTTYRPPHVVRQGP